MVTPQDDPFDESQYYAAYKQIRNKFRGYKSLELIASCIDYLYTPTKDRLGQLQKLPWLVLLLMKWVLIDDEFDEPGKKPLTKRDFYKILQKVADLGSVARLPSQFDHLTLFLRSMAYQQFLYQKEFSITHFARQKVLFSELPDNSLIRSNFRRLVGLDISDFLDLSLATLTWFVLKRNSALPLNWFGNLSSTFSASEIERFCVRGMAVTGRLRNIMNRLHFLSFLLFVLPGNSFVSIRMCYLGA